jgi:hypothetical protein
MALVPQYLRADEEARIYRQFQRDTWRCNKQVLWSGIPRGKGLSHPLCLRTKLKIERRVGQVYKRSFGYLRMVYLERRKGSSIVATAPRKIPSIWPNKLLSNRGVNCKGDSRTSAVPRIEMVHLIVRGAENIY